MPKTNEPDEIVKPETNATPDSESKLVKVRVLPAGDGKIATGGYDKLTNKFTHYKRGDVFPLDPDIAEVQEKNGLVEIVG